MSTSAGGLPEHDPVGARNLIAECNEVREAGSNETVVRQTLIAHLSDVFPTGIRPWWVLRHIRGAESHLRYLRRNQQGSGSADSLVGLTAIEYKPDLRNGSHVVKGQEQLRGYAAGLLNQGSDKEKCRLVLSDGVEWRAYRIRLAEERQAGQYGQEHVALELIEELECVGEDDVNALVSFLARYLGRDGMRPLRGAAIAADFGLGSALGRECAAELLEVIKERGKHDRQAFEMASYIRSRYASYVGIGKVEDDARGEYARECYLAILARLICANALEGRALHSPDNDLDSIVGGSYFDRMGLRVIEHDQFAWLLRGQRAALRPLARKLQSELISYDFGSSQGDDLFGELLAEIADPETRILLGQACTPMWLADQMAKALVKMLPEENSPRFVDMCCGSGSMLVAATRLERERLRRNGLTVGSQPFVDALAAAATGFDINPLAVLLARINWIVANRDAFGEIDGRIRIAPPVYHADSLFALAPVFAEGGGSSGAGDGKRLRIQLDDIVITAPEFLIEPPARELFDGLLERCRNIAEAHAADGQDVPSPEAVGKAVHGALAEAELPVDDATRDELHGFATELTGALARLELRGRNGIWSFVLGNSYRPAFYAGQFNGVLSNPPWLAMSKIRENPFGPVIRELADRYGLTPAGSSAPHLDACTVFLAHAIDRYLEDDGVVACVLPDTVRNGQHHRPFRDASVGRAADAPLRFRIEQLWSVDESTFDNLGVVILGRKHRTGSVEGIPGRRVSRQGAEDEPYVVRTSGGRMVWSGGREFARLQHTYSNVAAQGADLMPRRLVLFDVEDDEVDPVKVSPITPKSANWYLMRRIKKHADWRPKDRRVHARFVHPCLLSTHLAPFALAEPAQAVLPVLRGDDVWRLATPAEIAVETDVRDHFRDVVGASDYDSVGKFQAALDMRGKLTRQRWREGAWLVVYAAGGGIPAAAYVQIGARPAILDQTLYGFTVEREDEALYFCGVVNSPALRERIESFVPAGRFGGRHLHTIPQDETPRYNDADPAHVEVVAATRALVQALEARREDPEVGRQFKASVDLSARRVKLRAEIARLGEFERYDAATRALYGA